MDVKLGALGLGVLLVGAVVWEMSPFFVVHETERTVVTRFGQFSHVAGPGLHFRIPIVNGLETFPLGNQEFDAEHLNTYTIDNQELDAKIKLVYRIPENGVKQTWQFNRNYRLNMQTMAIDRFKQEMGKINITQVASHRGEVGMTTMKVIRDEALRLFGLEVVDFQMPNIDYTKEYRAGINAAATAKARVEQTEQELKVAEVNARQVAAKAKGEADAVRESARGTADARVLNAEAEAKSILVRGQAEAQAIKAQAEALGSNPNLVQLRIAEKWSGILPSQMFASAPLPLLNLDNKLVDVAKK